VQPAKPPKSGGLFKILLVAMVCLAAFLILAGTGVWYAAHRIKQAVVAKAHSYGMDMPSATRGVARNDVQVCELLPKDTVATLLHQPIDRTESQSQECLYYGPPGLSAKLSEEQMSGQVKDSQTPGNSVDGSTVADAATNLAGSIGHAVGIKDAADREIPLLTVVVADDGKAQMTVLSASKALLSGFRGAGAEVPNLGDRAIRLGNLGLNVLKGDTMVRIIPGPVPHAREKSVLVAREILPKL
jgi:hypothetical protein